MIVSIVIVISFSLPLHLFTFPNREIHSGLLHALLSPRHPFDSLLSTLVQCARCNKTDVDCKNKRLCLF